MSHFAQVGQLIAKNFFNDGDRIRETAFSADGLTVAIGAPYYGDSNEGTVRVLRWDTSAQVWNLLGTNQIVIFEPIYALGYYGWSVSLSSDGNRLAVVQRTSYISTATGNVFGSAYVYEYNSSTSQWASFGGNQSNFQNSFPGYYTCARLSSDGETLVVSSDTYDGGKGYVQMERYSSSTGNWAPIGVLIGSSSGDRLGTSLAISGSGDRIAVGSILSTAKGQVQVYDYSGPVTSWSQKGSTFTGANNNDYAHNVTLSRDGGTLAIGTREQTSGGYRGFVRAYQFDSSDEVNDWAQIGSDLTAGTSNDNEGFAYGTGSLALSADGTEIAVGSIYHHDEGGENKDIGAVYLFEYSTSSSTWSFLGSSVLGSRLLPVSTMQDDQFGYSVSIADDGRSFVTSARLAGENADGIASVFLYHGAPSGSEYSVKEDSSDLGSASVYSAVSSDGGTIAQLISGTAKVFQRLDGDVFQIGNSLTGGYTSVALSGDGTTLVLGNIGANSGAGEVQVFEYSSSSSSSSSSGNGSWTQFGSAVAGGSAGDSFGASVSCSSDGSRFAATANGAGTVAVFEKGASTYAQVGSNLAQLSSIGMPLKIHLSSDGSACAIGDPGYDAGGLTDRGRVLVFTESGGSWTQKGSTIDKIFSGVEVAYRRLGESVHVLDGGEELAIGTQPNGTSSTGLNRAYLFKYSLSQAGWYLAQSVSGKSREEDDGFGDKVSFSSDGSKLMVSAQGYSPDWETSYNGSYVQIFEREATYSVFVPVEEIDTSGSYAYNVSMSGDGSTVVRSGYPGAFLVTANNDLVTEAVTGSAATLTLQSSILSQVNADETLIEYMQKIETDYDLHIDLLANWNEFFKDVPLPGPTSDDQDSRSSGQDISGGGYYSYDLDPPSGCKKPRDRLEDAMDQSGNDGLADITLAENALSAFWTRCQDGNEANRMATGILQSHLQSIAKGLVGLFSSSGSLNALSSKNVIVYEPSGSSVHLEDANAEFEIRISETAVRDWMSQTGSYGQNVFKRVQLEQLFAACSDMGRYHIESADAQERTLGRQSSLANYRCLALRSGDRLQVKVVVYDEVGYVVNPSANRRTWLVSMRQTDTGGYTSRDGYSA